jgi:hypothetical protein
MSEKPSVWDERPLDSEGRARLSKWVRFLWFANFAFGAYLIVKGIALDGGEGAVVLGVVLMIVGLFFVVGMRQK